MVKGIGDALTLDQHPDGREGANDPEIAHVRVRPDWVRHSDYRPASFGMREVRRGDLPRCSTNQQDHGSPER